MAAPSSPLKLLYDLSSLLRSPMQSPKPRSTHEVLCSWIGESSLFSNLSADKQSKLVDRLVAVEREHGGTIEGLIELLNHQDGRWQSPECFQEVWVSQIFSQLMALDLALIANAKSISDEHQVGHLAMMEILFRQFSDSSQITGIQLFDADGSICERTMDLLVQACSFRDTISSSGQTMGPLCKSQLRSVIERMKERPVSEQIIWLIKTKLPEECVLHTLMQIGFRLIANEGVLLLPVSFMQEICNRLPFPVTLDIRFGKYNSTVLCQVQEQKIVIPLEADFSPLPKEILGFQESPLSHIMIAYYRAMLIAFVPPLHREIFYGIAISLEEGSIFRDAMMDIRFFPYRPDQIDKEEGTEAVKLGKAFLKTLVFHLNTVFQRGIDEKQIQEQIDSIVAYLRSQKPRFDFDRIFGMSGAIKYYYARLFPKVLDCLEKSLAIELQKV